VAVGRSRIPPPSGVASTCLLSSPPKRSSCVWQEDSRRAHGFLKVPQFGAWTPSWLYANPSAIMREIRWWSTIHRHERPDGSTNYRTPHTDKTAKKRCRTLHMVDGGKDARSPLMSGSRRVHPRLGTRYQRYGRAEFGNEDRSGLATRAHDQFFQTGVEPIPTAKQAEILSG